MGFLAAIPIGATQIEIAKRLIRGYTFSAIMIVAGAVISDFSYGAIALFGIAPYLQSRESIAIFSALNSIILIILGILTIRQNKKEKNEKENSKELLPKKNVAFITGFLLAVTNPLMIYWWLLGSRFLGSIYGVERYDTFFILLLLISGTLGIGSYPLTMLFGIYKAKKSFTESGIRKTTFIFGLALFGLAGYFMYEALNYFIKPG